MPLSLRMQTICALAKERNFELKKFIDDEVICIDFNEGTDTPIGLLAQEGAHEAVTFLMTQFYAHRNYAILGYARGGHVEQVDALLVQEGCRFTMLDFAIEGYAQGGHVEQVEALLAQLAAVSSGREKAIEGYARGGYVAQVEALLAQQVGNDDFLHILRKSAVLNYAQGGHIAQIDVQLSFAQSIDETHDMFIEALQGYARGGYVAQVDALLAQVSPMFLNGRRGDAILGYAQGGHVEQVEALLLLGEEGSIELISHAVPGYAQGGHIAQVEALLLRVQSIEHSLSHSNTIIENAVFGYNRGYHSIHPENLLRLMTLTNNLQLREKLSKRAPEATAPNVLLIKSYELCRLMRETHMSFSWARAWNPELQFLFYQGMLLMQKGQLPAHILLKISSFVTVFSDLSAHKFLHRHDEAGTRQLILGRNISLFRRQALLVGAIDDIDLAANSSSALARNSSQNDCMG